ncbi:MAG: galactosyldiacylglycerol synthase [Verrucomicrobia bacterium Tous-C9LFEB]|nr:MAG: galactosyldiacylglycerol synthase [Verrucomicrobia bacterium Tous-C9LFEB]
MSKKVLILSVSAGTGHVRAAQALEKAFRLEDPAAEVVHFDALVYTNKLFRDFYSKLYIKMVQDAPTMLGWLYKTSDEPWKTDKMRLMLDRLNTRPLIKFISEFNPDIVVCTHFLPAEIIAYLMAKKKLDTRLSIVVTDFDMHAMWLCSLFHRYFVALDETKVHLENLGLPADRVTVSGIPIDPIFNEPWDRAAIRIEAGLDPNIPLFLVSAGAMGVSPAEGVIEGLFRLQRPAQVVIVCGKNEELKARLAERVERAASPHVRVKLLGFTTEMHKWMAAADLFIGKPGGLTTAEALAMELPMVIVSPIPGQEERNSDHLLEKGIAIKCNEFTTLAYKITQLLENPSVIERMRAQARRYGRPHAAREIARVLLQEPSSQQPIAVPEEQQAEMQKVATLGKKS